MLRLSGTDPSAFAAFYDRYERSLVAYFRARTHDPELTADLTAEVFASVLERARQFDPRRAGGDSAVPWLFAVARHTFLKSLRDGRVASDARRRLGVLEPVSLEEDGYARVEAVASVEPELERALSDLPESQRATLIARIVEERDYDDIAAQLACSELVVRKRVSRALTALRAVLPARSKERCT